MNGLRKTAAALLILLLLGGCGRAAQVESSAPAAEHAKAAEEDIETTARVEEFVESTEAYPFEETEETQLRMTINGREVPVEWDECESVEELIKLAPLTIDMSMYGGFEQVGAVGRSIARSDSRMTTQSGDVVLYSGDKIVVFYGSNTWEYTKLGHINLSQSEMTELLSNGDATITVTKD